MNNNKIFYLILGVLICFLFLTFINGTFSTYQASNPSITCSNDGKYVYIVDQDNIIKSEDFGENWKKVTPQK